MRLRNAQERRKHWNKAAAQNVALPTETWREHITKRNRCLDVRQKLQNGEVKSINTLITYNLNIQKFACDAVTTFDESLLKRFLEALQNVKILDLNCGSGAFLFAALNILEPLYEICMERIAERLPAEPLQSRHRKIAIREPATMSPIIKPVFAKKLTAILLTAEK